MTWRPITRERLLGEVAAGLAKAEPELQSFFARVAREPSKWSLHPWGDLGGGFWVVAVFEGRALWFNDIEDGFNVSSSVEEGRIPESEYWCNQDELHWALRRLREPGGPQLGPPRPRQE